MHILFNKISYIRTIPGSFLRVTTLSLCILLSGFTLAQENKKQDSDRVAQFISKSVFNELAKAQEELQSNQQIVAEERLLNLIKKLKSRKKINHYDLAKSYESLVYLYNAKAETTSAIRYAKLSLALKVLNKDSKSHMLKILAFLHHQRDEHKLALEYIELWLRELNQPKAPAFFTAAQMYAVADNLPKANIYIDKGLQQQFSDAQFSKRKNWLELAANIKSQLKKHNEAAKILEVLINHWPADLKAYMRLAQQYQLLKLSEQSLAVLLAAYLVEYAQNKSHTKNKIEIFAGQLRSHHFPFLAGQVLAFYLKGVPIKGFEDYWLTQSNTWLQAREYNESNKVLTIAAQKSEDGRFDYQLCLGAFQAEKWALSLKGCQKASQKPLKEQDILTSEFLAGLSAFNLDDFNTASLVLQRCAKNTYATKDKLTSAVRNALNKRVKECQSWVQFIEKREQGNTQG